jgi:transposase-like protein
MPHPHPPGFRQRVVELARLRDKPVAEIAKDLGVSDSCLRNWMAQADVDEGRREGLSSGEREELVELRRQARTPEARPVPNVAQMQTRAARADRPAVDLRRLVAGFLRMAPDVAVVGEVRDREALLELLSHVDTPADLHRTESGSRRASLKQAPWRWTLRLAVAN